MLRNTPSRQAGVNLVELMVGIAVSLILMAGVITLILRVSVSGGESVQSTRLNQQMRGTMDQITKELQRSGYVDWYEAWDHCQGDSDSGNDGTVNGTLVDVNVGDNGASAGYEPGIEDFFTCAVPVLDEFGDVQLVSFSTEGDPGSGVANGDCETDCDCILYSYDNNDSTGGTDQRGNGLREDQEQFGFRLNNGSVESLFPDSSGTKTCVQAGEWEPITDDTVEVTSLTFSRVWADTTGAGNDSTRYALTEGDWNGSLDTSCIPVSDESGASVLPVEDGESVCVERRSVAIALEGRLTADNTVAAQIGTADDPIKVKLKNDYFNTDQ